jgi:hypothetical protein
MAGYGHINVGKDRYIRRRNLTVLIANLYKRK